MISARLVALKTIRMPTTPSASPALICLLTSLCSYLLHEHLKFNLPKWSVTSSCSLPHLREGLPHLFTSILFYCIPSARQSLAHEVLNEYMNEWMGGRV